MSNEESTVIAGSSPAMRTSFPQENGEVASTDTVSTQETAASEDTVKFPKLIKRRGRTRATIYAQGKHYPL